MLEKKMNEIGGMYSSCQLVRCLLMNLLARKKPAIQRYMTGGFQGIFCGIFTPKLGEMIQFDLRIFFKMGWFHHQPSLKLTSENGWLGDDPFLLGPGLFSGAILVLGRVVTVTPLKGGRPPDQSIPFTSPVS